MPALIKIKPEPPLLKAHLISLLQQTLTSLQQQQQLPADLNAPINIERSKDKNHGDFACNIAMVLAKPAKMNPRQIASLFIEHLPADPMLAKAEIAGPGFINLFLTDSAKQQVVAEVLKHAGQ